MSREDNRVWVFQGSGSQNVSACFSCKEKAERWIAQHALSGLLTAYPIDNPAYEWAVQNQIITPSKDYQKTAKFIQNFSSAHLEHHHYENGQEA
ncbi:hypothetical protein H9Q10_02415 [Eikenella sp. S3360]|uniref:DUF7710 domain-containing protein n=1 Tax=Eikenella glucosivorans TaxID=2766967 RepID=A0ABS0N8A1_9NEIS|nr:hypothetical protein [Eikenella glucosivorans]MBH5328527.1 hypothetical protein [Eikenella glucosivorans]